MVEEPEAASSSSINESALLSGLCKPVQQTKHKYHERYTKISEAG
ncbi:MAG: hypothetical protein AAF410_04050 [Pseudomonadota bacterium]